MKIAIIGSGIAGNVAANYLHKDHDITLFEANDYVGGHTHTHPISWNNKEYAIDTGFIVFNYGMGEAIGVTEDITEEMFREFGRQKDYWASK